MPAIRHREPNNVCASVLGEIPGGVAYVKKSPKVRQPASAAPITWLGFVCKAGCRKMSSGHYGKLLAASITNGDGFTGNWKDLKADDYVVCLLMYLGDARYGAFALVDREGWPIVRNDSQPLLTLVTNIPQRKVLGFSR